MKDAKVESKKEDDDVVNFYQKSKNSNVKITNRKI